MEKTLQQLLDAELKAQQIATQAEEERERIIQGAIMEARAEEERFTTRIPDLHQSFLDKAESRAETTINELKRRYDDRRSKLRNIAEERENEALEAAFALIVNPEAES